MADIANIKPSERTIEMHHPKDETQLLGIRISVMSITDPRMKKIRNSIKDAKLRLEARGKNFKSDDVEENQNALLFGAMTGWEWYNPTGEPDGEANFHGKKPEFTKPMVTMVLTELEWMADQISEAISDEKAFF